MRLDLAKMRWIVVSHNAVKKPVFFTTAYRGWLPASWHSGRDGDGPGGLSLERASEARRYHYVFREDLQGPVFVSGGHDEIHISIAIRQGRRKTP